MQALSYTTVSYATGSRFCKDCEDPLSLGHKVFQAASGIYLTSARRPSDEGCATSHRLKWGDIFIGTWIRAFHDFIPVLQLS